MSQIRTSLTVSARILVALVFVINGLGLVDQSVAIHGMIARGIPAPLAMALSIAGRVIEIFAGLGLALGLYQRVCTVALIAFLIPATLIAHPFWIEPSHLFQLQLVNFLKNLVIIGGLLFIGSVGLRTTRLEGTRA